MRAPTRRCRLTGEADRKHVAGYNRSVREFRIDELGCGGFGIVYCARDVVLDVEREEQMATEHNDEKRAAAGRKGSPWKWAVRIGAGWVVLCLVAALVVFRREIGVALFATRTPPATDTPTATVTRALTNTPGATATPTYRVGSTMTRPVDGMVMVYVPGGTFLMGSEDGEPDERPVHTVSLDGYWIDMTEVTNGMYALCEQAEDCAAPVRTGSYTRSSYYGDSKYDDYPVIYVSWNDAAAYCAWAGGRLPTEAEWEVAARGEDGWKYPWGNSSPGQNLLNYNLNTGDTSAVGSYPGGASPFGALDMAGNVWEWVADWYRAYSSSSTHNPMGPSSGEYRVLRGGSWNGDEYNVRSSARDLYDPYFTNVRVGFRCSGSQP